MCSWDTFCSHPKPKMYCKLPNQETSLLLVTLSSSPKTMPKRTKLCQARCCLIHFSPNPGSQEGLHHSQPWALSLAYQPCNSCGVKGGLSPNYLSKKNNVPEENPSTEHSTFTCSLCCACPDGSSWAFGCKRASWPVSSVGITWHLEKQSSAQIWLFCEFRPQT